MPHNLTKTAFYFDELSDKAKEKARQWWRDCENEIGGDYSAAYDDAEQIADILGITLDKRPVTTMGGSTRYEPAIYWSGFWSQGDGACFEGTYNNAPDAPAKIREHAPVDAELHRIADELHALQSHLPSTVSATVKHSGHYSHSRCTDIDVTNDNPDADEGNNYPKTETQEAVAELLRAFMNWIYRQLESEYEYIMSDENVDDSIRCNEYDFDESGNRVT